MTEKQKTKIQELRKQGLSYGDISEMMGISKNTVKSVLRRQMDYKPERTVHEEAKHCLLCGKALVNIPNRKAKKFCSDKCRMQWWNAHRELVKVNAVYDIECAVCHRHFNSYGHKERKYCSRGCYYQGRYGGEHGREQ